MKRKAAPGIMITLLLVSMLILASNIQHVKAIGTIYIRSDGSLDPPTAHDIATVNVTPSKTIIGQGYNLETNVTVANQGDLHETFNVTLYAESNLPINETGLVGDWKFDEGGGTTAQDLSGNGNDGIIHGASWVSGHNGSALSFDGVDDYVEVLDSPTLNPPLITVMAWVNFKGFPAPGLYEWRNSMIISKGTNVPTNGNYCLFAQTVDETRIYFQITEMGSWTWVGGTTNIIEGKWYHVAGTYDGSVLRVYVNGVLDSEQTVNVARTSNSENLQIGALRQPGWEYWANGTIDEVRIYDRALSREEISAHVHSWAIGERTVTLQSGTSTSLTFTWNISGFANGNYTLSAYATPVPGEVDTADNSFVDGTILVTVVGDVNGDKTVNVFDILAVKSRWGTTPASPDWIPEYDANDDDAINVFDILTIKAHWGQSW